MLNRLILIYLYLSYVSTNEFSIEQLDPDNISQSENIFFILSVTGESSSTGIFSEIDNTKPSFKGSFNFVTDNKVVESILIEDLASISGISSERFRIISIIKTLNSQNVLVEFEILPVTDNSQLTTGEIFQKLKTSSGISTTYLSNIASETFMEKCADDQFRVNCKIEPKNMLWIIPIIVSGCVILTTTFFVVYKYRIYKLQKNIVTLLKTQSFSQSIKKEESAEQIDSLPEPIINTFMDNPIPRDSADVKENSTEKKPKKRLHTVLPGKKQNYTKKRLYIVLPEKVKRNIDRLIPLEFPNKGKNYEEDYSSDSSSDSSCQSSESSTPSISYENSYSNFIKTAVSKSHI